MKKSIASLWWPEHLRIALCPDRVIVTRLAVGWRGRVLDKQIIECAPALSGSAWQAPLTALSEAIDTFKTPKTTFSIILSNHFVRFTVVPWRDSVDGRAEQAALATHCFKNIYGGIAATWDIRVSDGGFRRNAVASAVDRDLTTQLENLARGQNLSFSSVQPYFMSACNQFRTELTTEKTGCFAVLEPSRAVVGIFDHSGWQSLTVRRFAADDPAAFAALLTQEMSSAQVAEPLEHVFVAALDEPKLDLSNEVSAARVLQLKARNGFSPFEDARYAMAMCGAA